MKYAGPFSAISASLQFTYKSLADLLVPMFKHFTGQGPEPDLLKTHVETEWKADGRSHAFVSNLKLYLNALSAMRKHASQMVWFRYGHVVASRYMWINDLVEVTH